MQQETFKDLRLRQAMPRGGRGRLAWIATGKKFCPREGWTFWHSEWRNDFAALRDYMWERMTRPGVKVITRKQRIY